VDDASRTTHACSLPRACRRSLSAGPAARAEAPALPPGPALLAPPKLQTPFESNHKSNPQFQTRRQKNRI